MEKVMNHQEDGQPVQIRVSDSQAEVTEPFIETAKDSEFSQQRQGDEQAAGAHIFAEHEHLYVFPATYAQQQLWFLYRMNPEVATYSIPLAYELQGSIQVDALEQAMNDAVHRHEALRTRFIEMDEQLQQVVEPARTIKLDQLDLRAKSKKESAQYAMQRYIEEESARPFDLSNDELMRVALLQLSENNYVLFINFHHIIMDHLSIWQWQRELKEDYRRRLQPDSKAAEPAPLQLGDYAVWQAANQTHESLQDKLNFWVDAVRDKDHFLPLPTDYPRPAVGRMLGEEYRFRFSQKVSEGIKKFSQSQGVSAFVNLLSGLYVLFHRYSRQNDVTIGCPFANRGQQAEVNDILGCFINTVPLPITMDGQEPFKELVGRVRQMVLQGAQHQEVPFESIVEGINPKRALSYNPLFQVSFTYQEPPMTLNLDGLRIKNLDIHNHTAKFDLFFWLWDDEDEVISGLLEFNVEIFHRDRIHRMIGHLERLLVDAIAHSQKEIGKLAIVPEDEYRFLTSEVNNNLLALPDQKSWLPLFRFCVNQYAAKTAVSDGQQSLSYRQLSDLSDELASQLIQIGLNDQTLVAIALERNCILLVALLAVLKSGAAYLPLDTDFPQERLAYMLADSQAAYCLTSKKLKEALPEHQSLYLYIDEMLEQPVASTDIEKVIFRERSIESEQLAYVIYTSGSTGKPKGVKVPHGAKLNFLASMAKTPGMNPNHHLLAVTTLSFDIAVLELYLPLVTGARVTIADKETSQDGEALIQMMETSGVNYMQATPATWRLLLASGWKGHADFILLSGGEAFPKDLVGSLSKKVKQVWNMFGPTETTVWSSCAQIQSESQITIGQPIGNTHLYCLDEHQQLVPVGIPGELYIGGKGVTLGYLNRPELTRERFIPDPFARNNDQIQQLYRTGDLCWVDTMGVFHYLHRIDNQVKVRGFRIELGEIEAALSDLDQVAQAVAEVKEARPGDQRLVAYIRSEVGEQFTITQLRAGLREVLPAYMIPQHLVQMDEIPQTPNGKVDRKALPTPFQQGAAKKKGTLPRNRAEKFLAKIWMDCLKVEQVYLQDNFFELGGHSLLSIEVLSQIRRQTGVRLSPRVMLLNSLDTVASHLNRYFQEQSQESQQQSETQAIATKPFEQFGSAVGKKVKFWLKNIAKKITDS